jgi:hypothetical protein
VPQKMHFGLIYRILVVIVGVSLLGGSNVRTR